ncbi:MAG: CocE/NonD family hydrolase [Euryarchaeota archaeon]|nr:CocE/NonD family hydrolase [Euryarchaeota archaeon]
MTKNQGFAVAAVFLMSALGGCVTTPAAVDAQSLPAPGAGLLPVDPAGLVPKLFGGYIHSFVDFKSGMGDTIHADLYVPDHEKLDKKGVASFLAASAALPIGWTVRAQDGALEVKHPVVVFASPYHDSKNASDPERKRASAFDLWIMAQLVPRGYAFATMELPGTVGSGGCWDFMGPHEQQAMYDTVEYFGTQPWSNGKVGMIGVSYDGMTQIMAMAKKPPHLAAVVPIAALTSAYMGVYTNGVPYTGFWPTVIASYNVLIGLAPSPVETGTNPGLQDEILAGWAEHVAGNVACLPENLKEGALNLGDYNAYYKARDFRPLAKTITVPTFQIQGFLDANVRADNAFPWVGDLAGPKTVWLGQWFHSSANMSNSGRDDMYLRVHQFWDRYLYDVENGYESDNLGFFVQDSDGRWRREAIWPPADAADLEFHLSKGVLGASSWGEAETIIDDGARNYASANLAQPNVLVYRGDPLQQAAHLAGLPRLSVVAQTSRVAANLVAGLVDCGPDATDVTKEKCVLVSRGAVNFRHRDGIENPKVVSPDSAYRLDFHFIPRDYVFAAGHEIVLIVSGSDTSWFFSATGGVPQGPPVATATDPALDSVSRLTVQHDEANPAVLTLPMVVRGDADVLFVACGLPMKDKPCYVKDKKDIKEY